MSVTHVVCIVGINTTTTIPSYALPFPRSIGISSLTPVDVEKRELNSPVETIYIFVRKYTPHVLCFPNAQLKFQNKIPF